MRVSEMMPHSATRNGVEHEARNMLLSGKKTTMVPSGSPRVTDNQILPTKSGMLCSSGETEAELTGGGVGAGATGARSDCREQPHKVSRAIVLTDELLEIIDRTRYTTT